MQRNTNATSLCGIRVSRRTTTSVDKAYRGHGVPAIYIRPRLEAGPLFRLVINYMLRNIEGKTPDEVMATFKPDWRNAVSEKPLERAFTAKGFACGTEALDDFYPLMQATGIRDGFSIRSKGVFCKNAQWSWS